MRMLPSTPRFCIFRLARQLKNVDLPHPLGPITATNWPGNAYPETWWQRKKEEDNDHTIDCLWLGLNLDEANQCFLEITYYCQVWGVHNKVHDRSYRIPWRGHTRSNFSRWCLPYPSKEGSPHRNHSASKHPGMRRHGFRWREVDDCGLGLSFHL